jgi:5'-deoxynucleotidase YfbR-like HD superfamily hydrolase
MVMPETVGQHTFNMVHLAMILTEGQMSVPLFQAMLSHDLGEYMTGDLPSPMKKRLPVEFKDHLVEVEAQAIEGIHPNAPMDLKPHEVNLLMLCDNLDGLLKCMDELTMGNGFALTFGNRYYDYIKEFMKDTGDLMHEDAVWEILDKYKEIRRAYEPRWLYTPTYDHCG